MKKFWNWKKKAVNLESGQEAEERILFMNGVIAEDSWFDDDVTPALFKDELNAGTGDITLWINSPGGDCVAAAQIFNMLSEYPGKVTVKIDGLVQFGKALANAEEDAFLNGNGTGKPTGIFDGTGGGHLLNTLAAALKSDDMLDLVYGLKRPYRKNASFIMNDATLPSLRKLKDNNGAYIWQPAYQAGEPDRILGYKVETSAYAPKDGIAFGDYSYYNIGDRGNRSFKQLNELFAGNGMIGFVAKERVDGKLVLPEAVQIMKLKAD